MTGPVALGAQVDSWLKPLHGDFEPCGRDPEYDNDFLALYRAVSGKPESQFGPAEAPDWARARDYAALLFDRCRDLRVAIAWARAILVLEGITGLAPGLRLIHGLLDGQWEALHPQLDDGDPYARVNALALLRLPEGLPSQLRATRIIDSRGIGELTIHQVEVASGTATPRPKEAALTREQAMLMLAAALQQTPLLRDHLTLALEQVRALSALLQARLGAEAPDLRALQALLDSVLALLPAQAEPAAAGPNVPALAAVPALAPAAGLSGSVRSRADAIRAIDMVCEYLEGAEPTSPAQLLLRRSRRLINQNFLQLMKEFAPAAMADVARVMGIDPESVKVDNAP